MKTVSVIGLLILATITQARAEMTSGQTNSNEAYYCVPCKKWIFPKLGAKNTAVADASIGESAAPGKAHKANDEVDTSGSSPH